MNYDLSKLSMWLGANKLSLALIRKMIYHSFFGTHLLYVCQLWGHNNKETQNKFRTLQNRALKRELFLKAPRITEVI